jgi:hypothetical protein
MYHLQSGSNRCCNLLFLKISNVVITFVFLTSCNQCIIIVASRISLQLQLGKLAENRRERVAITPVVAIEVIAVLQLECLWSCN